MSKPTSFVAFVRSLGVKLTRAQRVLVSVAFDGAEPSALRGAEREVARQLFGDVDTVPPSARAVVALVAGARGGKSYLGALWLLWRSLVADLSSLAPGERAVALIVAPDLRLARQVLRYVAGAVKSRSELARLIASEASDAIVLQRPDGCLVSVEALPATRGGSAVRGRSLVAALLDECAFFHDADFAINDADVFAAVAPRIIPGGQVVLSSTPWAEAGLLFELFAANHGRPSTALAAHAPTTLLRDDERTLAMVERERQRDPQNATREYDAAFLPAGSGQWFAPDAIRQCIVERPGSLAPVRFAELGVGVDLGFRSDASALVVVRFEGDRYRVAECLELRPSKGSPLVPSAVVGAFAEVAKRHGAESVVADLVYVEALREHAQAHALAVREAASGQAGKLAAYTKARNLIAEGRVEISSEHKRLLQQLREVVGRPTSGGGFAISSPRKGGAHGDLASAFVLALAEVESATAAVDAGPLISVDSRWGAEPGAVRARASSRAPRFPPGATNVCGRAYTDSNGERRYILPE